MKRKEVIFSVIVLGFCFLFTGCNKNNSNQPIVNVTDSKASSIEYEEIESSSSIQESSSNVGYLISEESPTEEVPATSNTEQETETQAIYPLTEDSVMELYSIVNEEEATQTIKTTTDNFPEEKEEIGEKEEKSTENTDLTQDSVQYPQSSPQSTPDTSDIQSQEIEQAQDNTVSDELTPEERALVDALWAEEGSIGTVEEKPLYDVSEGLGFDTSNVIMH